MFDMHTRTGEPVIRRNFNSPWRAHAHFDAAQVSELTRVSCIFKVPIWLPTRIDRKAEQPFFFLFLLKFSFFHFFLSYRSFGRGYGQV